MKEEIWKEVENYTNYEVSNLGRIRNNKFKNPRLLYGSFDKDGYIKVELKMVGKPHGHFRLHRLIAACFIDNPDNKPEVNHKNGIKDDNRLDNLEWVTASENVKHAFDIGLKTQKGSANNCAKLTEENVREIKTLLQDGNMTQVVIAEKFGLHARYISLIKSGRRWGHVNV